MGLTYFTGQWLRKTLPTVIFANSNVPEKCFQVFLDEDKICKLSEGSKKIFKQNIEDRLVDCRNTTRSVGKFVILDILRFAEFSRYCYLPLNLKFKKK